MMVRSNESQCRKRAQYSLELHPKPLAYLACTILQYVRNIPSFSMVSNMNECCILSNAFYTSIEIFM